MSRPGLAALLFPLLATAAPKLDFNRDVRPILSDQCFACHGPDEKNRMAGLRLDTPDGAARVVAPGDPAKSRLMQRIAAEKKAMRMPPPSTGRELTAAQMDIIKRWIAEGAEFKGHWAYTPPRRLDPPAVSNAKWPRNAIDHFLLARLDREGLKPSPEADKTTLLRRVSLDLTGLPPTQAEVREFLADKSADAYEKAVDRLLASPHYGERMAMVWLDLARYADTHGYHIDSHRDMWPWRDWVIRSFNHNLPFDQFVVQQIAGDLLPNATLDQKIATGFNRNHMINFEGGAIPEEYLNEYVADRVETTSTVFLGMTMGCARCHDHKYDPIRQKDFYQFYAFFNNVPEKGLDGRFGNAAPVLPLPTPEQAAEESRLKTEIAAREKALEEKTVSAAQTAWAAQAREDFPPMPVKGLMAHWDFDANLADTSGRFQYGRVTRGDALYTAGVVGRAADFGGETDVALAPVRALDSGPFTVSAWLRLGGKEQVTVLRQIADEKTRRGFEIWTDESINIGPQIRWSYLFVRLSREYPQDALEVRTRERVRRGQWVHLTAAYDGSRLQLYLDGKPAPVEVRRNTLSGAPESGAALRLVRYKGAIDDLRVYSRVLDAAEIDDIAVRHPARFLLSGAGGKRTKDEDARLREYYLTREAATEWRTAWAELKKLRTERAELEKKILTVMVMEEMPKPRDSYVLGRGDYRNRMEKVTADVPGALPRLKADAPRNRLGLAQWLVDPAHPLTARVAVNRFWSLYFGHGIVKTTEDFGSQGEGPVHPELLDWLATEFVRTGWDVKAMQRLIVTSAAYRQQSKVTPELLEKDPENRLLARGPRFRLSAETVRDAALRSSGLLAAKIGGPSVFPYQPQGLWDDMAYGDGFTAQSYTQGKGDDLYRRSLYTFWKRTVPPAAMSTFDAPDREKCTSRRPLTNTPLQALVLLNDPTYVEAARVLAQRAFQESKDPKARAAWLFREVTSRAPDARESSALLALLKSRTAHFKAQPGEAKKLLSVGDSPAAALPAPELAAWTTVASAILNLDEAVTKE